MSDSWDYFQKKYCSPGKTLYYCLRKIHEPERTSIIAIHAFYREVYDILFKCREPAIARIRLQWWRDEISRLFNGSPRHVITQKLLPNLKHFSLDRQYFFSIINGIDSYFNDAHFVDDAAIDSFILATTGSRDKLIMQVLKIDPEQQITIDKASLLSEHIYHLRYLKKHVDHHCVLLSQQNITKLNKLLHDKKLLFSFIEELEWNNSRNMTSLSQKYPYFSSYFRLTLLLFKKMQRRKYCIFMYFYTLNPIYKLLNCLRSHEAP